MTCRTMVGSAKRVTVHSVDYDAFLADIANLSRAVDLLYHALILHIVGVPDGLIRRRFLGGPHSHAACAVLAHCGLNVPNTQLG